MKNWQLIRDGKMEKKVFVLRARILDLVREWFRKEGFLEVETPCVVKHPDLAPDLDLFATDFVSKDGKRRERRFLQTSPEYAMKKLLGAGFEKIFQMSKSFRNAEFIGSPANEIAASFSAPSGEAPRNDSRHNPEFTMLEWYRAEADYRDIMSDTENMIKYVVQELAIDSRQLAEGGWEKLSVRDAFKKYAQLDLDGLRTVGLLRAAVEKKGYGLSAEYSWDDLFFLVMLNEIEPKLGFDAPVFLYDYPASQAALARKGPDPFWAERFELYIKGVELCNAFSELVDPVEQRQRFEGERATRRVMGKEEIPLDEDLLEALKTMPPCGGNALGIDRLVMVLLGKKSIEEVLLFPWE